VAVFYQRPPRFPCPQREILYAPRPPQGEKSSKFPLRGQGGVQAWRAFFIPPAGARGRKFLIAVNKCIVI